MNGDSLIREYLDSLPPDARFEQQRAFGDSPLLRVAIDRVLKLEPEEQKIVMAEFELYAETGEVDPGSLFGQILEEADALDAADAEARSRAAARRSTLMRYLARAGYEVKPSADLERSFSQVTPNDQAFLYALFELHVPLHLLEQEGVGTLAVERLREEGPKAIDYEHRATLPPGILLAVSVAYSVQYIAGEMRDESLYEAARQKRFFADEARKLRMKLPWGSWYRSSLREQAVEILAEDLGVDEDGIGQLDDLVRRWQRLVWVCESLEKQGVYFGGRAEALPHENGAALLAALSLQLEVLLHAPEIARELPRNPDRLLYRRHATRKLLGSINVRAEPELAAAFVEDIRNLRHYRLDHLARVELGGRYGIDRIVLAPERWDGDSGQVIYLVEHRRGVFPAMTIIPPSGIDAFGWPAGTIAPIFRSLDGEPVEDIAEALAPLTVLALAAWRNLVVPRVRDEHYEVIVRRKAKGSGKREARQARRGDLAIVEYFPRLLVMRRAEEAARAERGYHAPLRQVYRVSTFAKRLPEGQHRSVEADAFAKEIGIPVAPWQTIVRAHWRGGTPEEREAAEHTADVPVKEWRSWDAMDVLSR